MSLPVIPRTPTCLACLRRTTQTGTASVAPIFTQVRGKKTSGRPKDPGVVVRLKRDIVGFGKEGAIFRTERGRMRNQWYPTKKAEFMTPNRLKVLGLTRNDIGERDPLFGIHNEVEEEIVEDAVEAVAGYPYAPPLRGAEGLQRQQQQQPPKQHGVEIEAIAPNRALELLTTMIPETLVFERRLIHIPFTAAQKAQAEASAPSPEAEPEKPRALSPLQARRARKLEAEMKAGSKAAGAEEPAEHGKTPEELEKEREEERRRKEMEAEERIKIHGSVSTRDIAVAIKERMLLDLEASRVHVQPDEIRFLGAEEALDRVEKLGKFEVEIRTHMGRDRVEPLRRMIEVVAH